MMMTTTELNRAEWIHAFTTAMDRLEADAPLAALAEMGAELYPIMRHVDPNEAALTELNQWSRQDL